MSICAAADARIKHYFLTHFNLTCWGRNLNKLKSSHTGHRCFIIGNGPSLRAEDLDRLQNEYTFAFNRIYYIFEQTAWRPTFYCAQDFKLVSNSIEEINQKINTPFIFAPINLKWYYNIQLNTSYFFNQRLPSAENELPAFSEDISRWIGVGNTVAFTAMQLAAYMGFTEIYLLGVDHHFQISQNSKGEIVVDPTAKDYFSDNYNHDKAQLYIPNTEKSTLTYLAMQHHCNARNIRVFNATRGGKLEVFPRVEFDTLFK